MKKPLILVTNDDGITAPGIAALVDVVSKYGEVVVVAPNSPQSGQGHAITIETPLRLYPSNHFGKNVEAYECSGTPVDCVKLAKSILLKERKIDLCVSGINHGSNASINIIYSGTMSAAMEASLEGIESIGFSLLDYAQNADFSASKSVVKKVVDYVLENGIPAGNLLNVNIPKLPEAELKGIKICRQGKARWTEEYTEATDPRGQKYYWLTGKFVNEDPHNDSDIHALVNGYVSVVPSGHDLTNFETIEKIKGLEEPFKN